MKEQTSFENVVFLHFAVIVMDGVHASADRTVCAVGGMAGGCLGGGRVGGWWWCSRAYLFTLSDAAAPVPDVCRATALPCPKTRLLPVPA